MIVAGFGYRSAATAADLAAALDAALASAALTRGDIATLAIAASKQAGGAAAALAADTGHGVMTVSEAAMQAAGARCVTHSARSRAAHAVPSVAEAVALAAAGPGARLVQPRIATANATCALAEGDPA